MIWLFACVAAPDEGAPPSKDTDTVACSESRTWYPDADADTFGDPEGAVFLGCDPPGAFVLDDTDCDDADATIHPGATEACDGLDQDCDGQPDVGLAVWYTDADGDGFGDSASAEETCDPPEGAIAEGGDCDDGDAAVHPGADEGCDGDDDDCDGVADLGTVGVWHSDVDGDGYGSAYDRFESCSAPEAGYTQTGGDCQPSDPTTYPGAVESCNENDDDCDGDIDEDFEADNDGYRSDACEDGDDCDDTRADVYPDAEDGCEDGVDQDCDGEDRACGFGTSVDLNDAEVLYGEGSDDAGRQMKVGDVTGDGVDDLFVATLYSGSTNGGGYVYTAGTLASGDFADLAWRMESDLDSQGAGRSVGLGDMDGDGIGDIAFGSPYPSENGMRVILGPITADAEVGDGLWLVARPGEYAGHGADVGDVDGDGIEDAVVGAWNGFRGSGGVYVSYGPLTGNVDLEDDADARITGEGGYTGRWIRADGDFNGDGVSDILAAAPYGSLAVPYGGAMYMIYGPPPASLDLATDADGRYLGTNVNEYASIGMGEGDIDNDGLDDVLIGSYYSSRGEGAGYVFLGPAAADTDTAAADITIIGAPTDQLGADLLGADLDGDGDEELLIGSSAVAGGAWIFVGLGVGTWGVSDASTVVPALASGDTTGVAVQAGDLDGDGLAEIVLGSPGAGHNGIGSGEVRIMEYAR